ncbi:hypothetical protein TEA_016280 [Camellia sinensis var. sinensis]|uniref:Fungal lipase-like domain-containing protein n=1 Tax=Camellia sinensis var. sinensis TaxID=542762 RepID=A0A4S4EV72_CAMSN|nr:hypothetical protein TEA_016280 [Camellia sinensis var. sinensis]
MCLQLLGCLQWACKRCTYIGSYDSATWPPATAEEFEAVPRICRLILAVYEDDLRHPQFPPSGGYRLNPDCVIKRLTYQQTHGNAPPYIIYLDHHHREIVLAIRGLNLIKESDYKLLLDNGLGMQMFDGGFVHHGLLKSAIWLLNKESETLKRLWLENGSSYRIIFAGHSLGAGVAALLTVIVVNHRKELGGIPRDTVYCYAVAPARCMSLNLAVKYADVIHSVILQVRNLLDGDSCRKFRDPTRLYAPGRTYHIVERKFCRCGRYPPEVKTAIPVDGRFEHIVLSCNATSDHAIIWIEREAEKALEVTKIVVLALKLRPPLLLAHRCGRYPPEVKTAIPVDGRFEHIVLSCNATSDHAIIWIEREAEKALERMRENHYETTTAAPRVPKMERLQTIEKEHKDALERAVSLNIPHAATTHAEESKDGGDGDDAESSENEMKTKSMSSGGRTKWEMVVEKKLFKKNES